MLAMAVLSMPIAIGSSTASCLEPLYLSAAEGILGGWGLMPRILLVPALLGPCAPERSLSSPYNLAPLGRPHQHQDWRCKRQYLSGPA